MFSPLQFNKGNLIRFLTAIGSVSSWSAGSTGLTPSSPTAGDVVLGGTLNVGHGGTGLTATTVHGVVLGNGTSAMVVSPVGLSGQVFAGNTGADPSFQALSGLGVVTSFSAGTTGATPSSPTQGDIVLGGTFNVQHGGTGLTTATAHGVLLGQGISAMVVAAVGTTGQLLTGVTGVDPSFQAAPGASSATTFMGSDTAVSAVAFTNLVNTGSIGASGQVWLIMVTETAINTVGAAFVECAIFDGSAQIACVEGVTVGANLDISLATYKVVSLSGATTFTLQSRSNGASTTAKTSTSNVSNKATSITAVRLA